MSARFAARDLGGDEERTTVEAMAWWLIPITATLLAVAWVSWNSRTRRPADPHDTLAAHRRFTEALTPPTPLTATTDPEVPTAAADERRSA